MVYRRRELWLLLLLALGVGVGLAVREFRAGFPELTERLEAIDANEPPREPPRSVQLSAPEVRTDGRLDLNRATPAELQRLPGIGPILALRIVEARERQGRFASPEDLRRVPGIGPKKFEVIRDLVRVGP